MNLHGMTPERYIEILERTIRELKDQNELCTKRIAELLDERDKQNALLSEVAPDLPPDLYQKVNSEAETRRREKAQAPRMGYPGADQMDRWQRDYK